MKFLILLACIAAVSANGAWNAVKHNEVDILAAVFSAYPDIQARFPDFAGKDLGSVKGSAAFALHATRIVSFLDQVVSLSGNSATAPAVTSITTQLANTHKNRGISKAQFGEFRTALTSFVNPSGADAAEWNSILDNMYGIINNTL